MIGTTLAHYEITGLLGKGGMGEVYRAQDTKLGREVALKILPTMGDRGEERLARFQLEARTIAGLNHPNIVTLYAVEEANGVPFIAMELVDGASLTERIQGNGLALNQLLELAIPMADAVSCAHKQGITHRDLKPDNVMIDSAGRVKVLDFGLAKLLDNDAADDASQTIAVQHHTQDGLILGTAAYMSPEQAEGKPLDASSDVFSLGIVLYEMATGRKPFAGDTPISMISSIVKENPPSALEINRALPRQLGRILDRCLAKSPDRRYQSAIELRNELEVLQQESMSGELEAYASAGETVSRKRSPIPWIAAIAVAAAAAFFVGRMGASNDPGATAVSGDVVASSFEKLTSQGALEGYPSFAPSGRLIAYAAEDGGDWDIFLQRRGGQRPINLTEDSPVLDTWPAISPDGESIVFMSARQGRGLFTMGTTGEAVRRVVDEGNHPAWSPDGQSIVYSTAAWFRPASRDDEGVLRVVNVDGSERRDLTPADMDAAQPDWSRDGQWIAFWGVRPSSGQRDLWMIRADGSDAKDLTNDEALDWSPRFGPDGHFIYFLSDRGGTSNLWRIAIDSQKGGAVGPPRPVTLAGSSVQRFDLSRDGTEILFSSWSEESQAFRAKLPQQAVENPVVEQLTRGSTPISSMRLSPDGTRMVFTNGGSGFQDVFLVNADGSQMQRLTNDEFRDRGPSWNSRGDLIVFYSDRGGSYEIWTMRPDGGDLKQISAIADRSTDTEWFPKFSADDRHLATMNENGACIYDVNPTTGMLENRRDINPPDGGNFYSGAWSRDGLRLVGWVGELPSDGSGGLWIYDLATDTWSQVIESLNRGWLSLAFTHDGKAILVSLDGRLVRIEIGAVPLLDTDNDKFIVVLGGFEGAGNFSLAPDGSSILYVKGEQSSDIWVAGLTSPGGH